MPEMIDIFAWLEQTGFATRIRQSLWLFPIIETIHLFGIVLLVGSTSALDLRLMGVAMRDQPVSRLAARLLPWAWTGFVIQIITGTLLFSSEATRCYTNPAFRYKML